jgi:putative transposase
MRDIWMAATRAGALVAFNHFVDAYSARYPKVAEKLTEDRDELLAYPIESTFATVRHRTKRTRNYVSRAPFLGLAFQFIESAEQSWPRIRAPEKLTSMLDGIAFRDGEPAIDSTPAQQPLAA